MKTTVYTPICFADIELDTETTLQQVAITCEWSGQAPNPMALPPNFKGKRFRLTLECLDILETLEK